MSEILQGRLSAAVEAIDDQIGSLRDFRLEFAVRLLEMAKLELKMQQNNISPAEMADFCRCARDGIEK
jgi:hypothetical protein